MADKAPADAGLVDATPDVQDLLAGVNEWLTLQAEEMSQLMATMQSSHLQLLSELEFLSIDDAAVKEEAKGEAVGTKGVVASDYPALALVTAPPPAPSALPRAPASPPAREMCTEEASTRSSMPAAHGFSAIETVLATRRTRLSRWEGTPGSSAPPRPLLFGDSPLLPALHPGSTVPPSEPAMGDRGWLQQHLDRVAELRAGLSRWRRGASEAQLRRFRALGTAAAQDAAPRLALSAAVRRLIAWRRSSSAVHALLDRADAHALRAGWECWRRRGQYEASQRALVTRATCSADRHLRLARLAAQLRAWKVAASRARGVAVATGKVQVHARCRLTAGAMRCWSAWVRRRAVWRRGVERRAVAHGGWTRQHWPCMRDFDGRAAFIEEGSSGLVKAYRRRRGTAVVLCAWRALAVGVPMDTAAACVEEDEQEDLLSDREWELD